MKPEIIRKTYREINFLEIPRRIIPNQEAAFTWNAFIDYQENSIEQVMVTVSVLRAAVKYNVSELVAI